MCSSSTRSSAIDAVAGRGGDRHDGGELVPLSAACSMSGSSSRLGDQVDLVQHEHDRDRHVLQQLGHVLVAVARAASRRRTRARRRPLRAASRPRRRPSARSCGGAGDGCRACRRTRTAVVVVLDAEDAVPGRLRLVGDDRDFVPMIRLSSVDLPAFGPADEGDVAGFHPGSALDFRRRSAVAASARGPCGCAGARPPALRPAGRRARTIRRPRGRGRRASARSRRRSRIRPARSRRQADREPRRCSPCALNTNDPWPSSTIGSVSTSYSSRISPTISSSRSSIVTSPAVPPYSSTTIAICTCLRWNSFSISGTRLVSGHERRRADEPRQIAIEPHRPDFGAAEADQVLHEHHAGDVVEILVVHGDARNTPARGTARAGRRASRRPESPPCRDAAS